MVPLTGVPTGTDGLGTAVAKCAPDDTIFDLPVISATYSPDITPLQLLAWKPKEKLPSTHSKEEIERRLQKELDLLRSVT